MILLNVIMLVAFITLIIASITDIKRREVDDWVSYGLLFLAIGIRLISSLIYSDYNIILYGIYGFVIMFIIGMAMYYSGQWGGGDSKLLISLGALIGLRLEVSMLFDDTVFNLISFLFNILIVGAFYGLFYSFIIGAINFKALEGEFKKIITLKKSLFIFKTISVVSLILIVCSIFISANVFRFASMALIIISYLTYFLIIYVKSIEISCMIKSVNPDVLTEGDWIVEEIFDKNKKLIASPKDLGVSLEQIKKLKALYNKKIINKINVKYGIPFVPSFLIAFILTYILGNLFFYVIRFMAG